MFGYKTLRALLCGVFVLVCADGRAQVVPYTGVDRPWEPRIQFDRMPIEQGAFGWRFYAALQDDAGFVWFATRYGLLRFDGYTFTPIERDPEDPASVRTVWSGDGFMSKDVDGTFWFGTAAGLEHFDPVTRRVLARYEHDPADSSSIGSNRISAFARDSSGRYWIGTSTGLNLFDPVRGTFRPIYYTEPDGRRLSIGWVRAIAQDIDGKLWLGGADGWPWEANAENRLIGGLLRFDPETETFQKYYHSGPESGHTHDLEVESILVDRRGSVWFGMWSEDGLHRYDRTRDEVVHLAFDPGQPDALSAPRQRDAVVHGSDPLEPGIRFIHEDSEGIIWIGGFELGLNRYNPDTGVMQHYEADPSDPEGLIEDSLWGMLETREGTKWVLTWGGINRIRSTTGRFDFYRFRSSTSPALSDGRIAAAYEDNQGYLWFGTFFGGVNRVDRRTGAVRVYRNDPSDPASLGNDFVYRIAPFATDPNRLWLRTITGLSSLDLSTGRITNHFENFPDDHPDFNQIPDVRGLSIDGEFHIKDSWGAGLRICENGNDTCERIEASADRYGLHDAFITQSYCSRLTGCWIGTRDGGLFQMERFGTEWRFHQHLPDRSYITSIHERPNGELWVSSYLGLFWRALDGTWTRLTSQDGLPSTIVAHIIPHGDDELWIVTTAGLTRYQFSTGRFRHFVGENDLQKNFLYTTSAIRNEAGEIIIGGLNGFLAFHPDRVKALENLIAPRVYIDRFVGSSGLSPEKTETGNSVLRFDERDVELSYIGLHYDDPEQIRYMYRLDGYDADWIDAGARRSVRYPRLPAGDFTFRVRAANPDGYWSEDRTFAFTILPPWWRHPLAYLCYVLLAAGLIFAVDRMRRARLIARERMRASHEHARLVEDLDRTKTRFFVNLSHEFRTPLTLLLGPIRDALAGAYGEINPRLLHQLGPMHRAADRLHHMINQLLDLARLEAGGLRLEARAGDLVAFLRALTLSFASRAEREGKSLLLEAGPEAIEVYFDWDKFEKIVYNLLSNAFKFTAAGGKIRVAVEAVAGNVRITVRDTGEGIPASELPYIFDRFHQADASPTRRHEGSGIGLALAKELAELHHGALAAESQVGFGSTFTLTLPGGRAHLKDEEVIAEEAVGPHVDRVDGLDPVGGVDQADVQGHADPSASTAHSIQETPAHASSAQPIPTILLVEDNADVRAYLKSHLLAYHILEAEDGEAGLALALTEIPDLVISDVMMPRLDGYGLCAALRKDRRTQDIPVVLLTAKAAEEDKIEGLAAGADDYLYKPFSARELLARTENLIHRNQSLKKQYRQEVVLKPTQITVTSADAAWLEKVRAVVEAQMGESQFGVEQLAEEVGLGRRQLQRRIHELTGGTAHGYIQESRLERARQLLEQKAGNVSEVAYRVGFRDPRHFARLFQQRFGKPPSRWGGAV